MTTYTPRLKSKYVGELKSSLQSELKLANINDVPRLEKIIVSVGLGKANDDKRLIDVASNTLSRVTGQQPQATFAKKSIASFKLRQGMKVGLKVTLRGDRMYEFLDRLVNIVLPRVRDFRGLSAKAFDSSGNYSIGLRDQSVFPELSYEETALPHGLEVTIVSSVNDIETSRALLVGLGVPLEKKEIG